MVSDESLKDTSVLFSDILYNFLISLFFRTMEDFKMKDKKGHSHIRALFLMSSGLFLMSSGLFLISSGLFLLPGCDSGEKALDGLTGHQAVKQYNKTKDDIDDIVDRQNERLNGLDGDEDEDLILEEDEE